MQWITNVTAGAVTKLAGASCYNKIPVANSTSVSFTDLIVFCAMTVKPFQSSPLPDRLIGLVALRVAEGDLQVELLKVNPHSDFKPQQSFLPCQESWSTRTASRLLVVQGWEHNLRSEF